LIGSSLYTIRLLIEGPALSPVSGTDDSNSFAAQREAHGQNSTAYLAEGKVARLRSTMCGVFGEHESGIIEHTGCNLKRDAMLGHVATGLPFVPLELHYATVVEGI
jgi:hypothetical protein